MMFKLSQQVEKGWRKLRGFKEIPFVLEGKSYHNGSRMGEMGLVKFFV